MKTNRITLRPDRLDLPLAPQTVGKLSSAVFTIDGDIPADIEGLVVQIGRTPDGVTPRENLTAATTKKTDGTYECYLSPFYFPDEANGLKYHIVGRDAHDAPRWLGSGTLNVEENPANGSGVVPEVIPSDTYIRNPITGKYHKLTASVNELGEIAIDIDDEGVDR